MNSCCKTNEKINKWWIPVTSLQWSRLVLNASTSDGGELILGVVTLTGKERKKTVKYTKYTWGNCSKMVEKTCSGQGKVQGYAYMYIQNLKSMPLPSREYDVIVSYSLICLSFFLFISLQTPQATYHPGTLRGSSQLRVASLKTVPWGHPTSRGYLPSLQM